jgi:hypothetical protein
LNSLESLNQTSSELTTLLNTAESISTKTILTYFTGQVNYDQINTLGDTILQLINSATNSPSINATADNTTATNVSQTSTIAIDPNSLESTYNYTVMAFVNLNKVSDLYDNIQSAYMDCIQAFTDSRDIWQSYVDKQALAQSFYDNITQTMNMINTSSVSTSDPVYVSVYTDYMNAKDLFDLTLTIVQEIEQYKSNVVTYLKHSYDYLYRSFKIANKSIQLCNTASDYYNKKVSGQQRGSLTDSIQNIASFVSNEFNWILNAAKEEYIKVTVVFDKLYQDAKDAEQYAASKLADFESKAEQAAKNAQDQLNILKSDGEQAIKDAGKKLDDFKVAAQKEYQSVLDSLASAQNSANKTIDLLESQLAAAKQAIQTATDQMKFYSDAAIQDFVSGASSTLNSINNDINSFTDKISNFGNDVANGFCGVFGCG